MRWGFGTFEVVLADGRVVVFEDVNTSHIIPASTYGNLQTPTVAGRLARVTNSVRGLWQDTGTNWFGLAGEGTNVKEFGARGDGATDDSAAIQAAIDALPAGGGTVYFPPGIYSIASGLTLSARRNITLRGSGGFAGASAASDIRYSGTGTTPLLNAAGCSGITLQDLAFYYTSASFTGHVLDFSSTAYGRLVNVTVAGIGFRTAASLILLHGAQSFSAERTLLNNAVVGVMGRLDTSVYTTTCDFVGVAFGVLGAGFTTAAVKNAGESFSFYNCIVEALSSGAAGFYTQDLAFDDIGGARPVLNFTMIGCWLGDANASGTWIAIACRGLTLIGNRIANGSTTIDLKAPSQGIVLCGNTIGGAFGINLGTFAHEGLALKGNRFTSTNILSGNMPIVADLLGNSPQVPSTFVAVGTTPAQSGSVRLPNGVSSVTARNAAGSADLGILGLNASDQLEFPGIEHKYLRPLITLGGGAAPTFGTIGGSGPAAAGQNSWMKFIDSTGAAFYLPVWK